MKVLVTGGASGIGLSLIRHLLEYTDDEIIATVNNTLLPSDLEQFLGSRIKVLKIDLSSAQAGFNLYEELREDIPMIQRIAFCHGVNKPASIFESSISDFDFIYNTNFMSIYSFFNSFKVIPVNLRSVVLVSSFCGHVGGPKTAHYAISKSSLDTLALNLSRQLASNSTRVNSIAPGFVKTRMINGDIDDSMKKNILLGRAAEPSEIAKCIYFLLSDSSSYITGQCLHVDGGLRL